MYKVDKVVNKGLQEEEQNKLSQNVVQVGIEPKTDCTTIQDPLSTLQDPQSITQSPQSTT